MCQNILSPYSVIYVSYKTFICVWSWNAENGEICAFAIYLHMFSTNHDPYKIVILEFLTSDCSQNRAWRHVKRTSLTTSIENLHVWRPSYQQCTFKALVARIDDHSIAMILCWFLNTSWPVGLTYWIVYLHFLCHFLTHAIIYVLLHHISFGYIYTS